MITPTVTIDGRPVAIADETNLLELIRKAGIELPTFCYHSELSVYGACRLCIVEIEGRGIQASCSVRPEPGLVVRTHTPALRETRKITIELLLANGHQGCVTCRKSPDCKLLDIARRLGVDTIRFRATKDSAPADETSPSLVREPGKCVLCGDCVRFCDEIQGVGAIHFAHRGSQAAVMPAFNRGLGHSECVNCGQCAAVCPTGAILPRSHTREAWELLADPTRRVVAQLAPAVRVGLGEAFGLPPGEAATGRIVAALRALGFAEVYDTAFAADLTVLEEGHELMGRMAAGERMPQFTSCCPAWVKFAEQYYPEILPNLSTCRSPQQMFGSLAVELLPARLGVARDRLSVVSVMPCTAKKFEAGRPEFARGGRPDVDLVLTTQELVGMIRSAGLRFEDLGEALFSQPFGLQTGAGVIFGHSGGVTEAVARYVAAGCGRDAAVRVEMPELRGEGAVREGVLRIGERVLRLAVVYGLRAARRVAEAARQGDCAYDFVEVMACPNGCIGGGGQPVSTGRSARRKRARGLYREAGAIPGQASQENPAVSALYAGLLGEPGSRRAHDLLHTRYQFRRRHAGEDMALNPSVADPALRVSVCMGTSCFLKGSQALLRDFMEWLRQEGLEDRVDVRATFCHERCDKGPTVEIDGEVREHCSLETLKGCVMERVAP